MPEVKPVPSQMTNPSRTYGPTGGAQPAATNLDDDGLIMYDKGLVSIDGEVKKIHFCRNEKGHIVGCEADLSSGVFLPIWQLWTDNAQHMAWARREEILRKDGELGIIKVADQTVTCLCGRKSKSSTIFGYFTHYYIEHMIECKVIQAILRERFRTKTVINGNTGHTENVAFDTREGVEQTVESPSSLLDAPVAQNEPKENREITENPQDDQRGQISDSNGTENGGVLDARRAAIQALPFAGSINPSWVECTACKKIVRLQGNLYRSYRFELHSKSKTHLQAVENLNSGDHSTTSSGKVDDMASHKEPSQKPRTRNNKQSWTRLRTRAPSHKESLAIRSSNRSSNRGDGISESSSAGNSTGTGATVQSSFGASGAPNMSTARFQAGSAGRMEGVVTVDGQRRKVIECTISEGFTPKRMDLTLTF